MATLGERDLCGDPVALTEDFDSQAAGYPEHGPAAVDDLGFLEALQVGWLFTEIEWVCKWITREMEWVRELGR
jgi:hypothetical protein